MVKTSAEMKWILWSRWPHRGL